MSQPDSHVKSTACNLCFVNCGVKVELGGEDGRRFVKVTGDENHPTSRGYICNKATRLDYYQNSPSRLSSPMRRRADGSYEAVDWETAIREVTAGLQAVREAHGGERILYYGGGAQGNHLGSASAMALRSALGIRYKSNAVSQEKTGLSWVLGRMIGETGLSIDVHHAQVAMFVGKNPFMSNGIDRARPFLREISRDPARTLIVVDPRRTETADYADIHLRVTPGRDAWLMAALVASLVQRDLLPGDWLAEHATGHEQVIEAFRDIPVADYARFAGVEPALLEQAATAIGTAETFALEEDLGIQLAPHSTLVTYLNTLAMLLTGNYGRDGTVTMTTQLAPVLPPHRAKVDATGTEVDVPRMPVTGAPIVSGLFPAALMADEILGEHPERPRALIVESSNPVHSLPESGKLRAAMRRLDFSVVVDVAMTETAREADYVLPASSQYEKWEATFFPRNYPANVFYLREPLLTPLDNTLTEAEIHARIIDALGLFSDGELAPLRAAAEQGLAAYRDAFMAAMGSNPKIARTLSYVLYRTLGPALGAGRESTASLWGLCTMYCMKHAAEAARAGYSGPDAGDRLFEALLESDTAVTIGISEAADAFARLPFEDGRLQLVIRELLDELQTLETMQPLVPLDSEYPLALMAGARGAYTANCAIRDPRWARGRNVTSLSMHPDDGERFGLPDGARVRLETRGGAVEVALAYDERMHPGQVSVPNGQGMSFVDDQGNALPSGVFVNELTSTAHVDRFIGTPLHKFVPARVSLA